MMDVRWNNFGLFAGEYLFFIAGAEATSAAGDRESYRVIKDLKAANQPASL